MLAAKLYIPSTIIKTKMNLVHLFGQIAVLKVSANLLKYTTFDGVFFLHIFMCKTNTK